MEGRSDGASSELVPVAATATAREGDLASDSQVKVNETVPVLGAGMRTSSDHSFSFSRRRSSARLWRICGGLMAEIHNIK